MSSSEISPKGADQIGWLRWLPGLVTLRQYEIAWLPHDIVAGGRAFPLADIGAKELIKRWYLKEVPITLPQRNTNSEN